MAERTRRQMATTTRNINPCRVREPTIDSYSYARYPGLGNNVTIIVTT